MLIIDDSSILQALCAHRGQWGIMAEITLKDDTPVESWRDELSRATKGLIDIHDEKCYYVAEALVRTAGGTATVYLLFDTEEEMHDAFYNRIYGDDNAEDHGYVGVYHTIRCLTCNPSGELENENS